MSKYFGDLKRELSGKENKPQKQQFKVEITDWIDGVLNKNEYFFESFDKSMEFIIDKEGYIKIYDYKNRLVYSETHTHRHGHHDHDHHDHGHHGGHDHEDHGHHGHHGHDDDDYN